MRALLRLLLLPIQAPMLLLLVGVSTYLGLRWSLPLEQARTDPPAQLSLFWSVECLQAMAVVVVCTMPTLLLRQISSMMASSRVISLVVTLLLVTVGGLYLIHVEVLANVLILASAVLLARLDLVRIRVVPPPLVISTVLGVVVLAGLSLGRLLS
jgi:hypothetical protein